MGNSDAAPNGYAVQAEREVPFGSRKKVTLICV
jgi:hypothetical protein